MKIKRLEINSFGKLKNVNINLDERVTVITGKNEAGKSTIASFIKYMLYGFTSSRNASLSENDKKKYMPWDEDEVFGKMDFSSDKGKDFTVVRKTDKRNQNSILTDDGSTHFSSENAGDIFLGVSGEVYDRTAFCSQSDVAFTSAESLFSAINNIALSADESLDSDEAMKKLENAKKLLLGKTGRTGKIFEIDKELEVLEAEKIKWQDGHKRLLASEHNLEVTQNKINENKAKLEVLIKQQKNIIAKKAAEKLYEIEEAGKQVEEIRHNLEKAKENLDFDGFFADAQFLRNLDQNIFSVGKCLEDLQTCENVEKNAKENYNKALSGKGFESISNALEKYAKTPIQVISDVKEMSEKARKNKNLCVLFFALVVTFPIAFYFLFKYKKEKANLIALVNDFGAKDAEELEDKLVKYSDIKGYLDKTNLEYKSAVENKNRAQKALDEAKNELDGDISKCGVGFEKQDTQKFLDGAKRLFESLSNNISKVLDLRAQLDKSLVKLQTLQSENDIDALKNQSLEFDENVAEKPESDVRKEIDFYTQANELLSAKKNELEKESAVLSGTLPKPSEMQTRISSLAQLRGELFEKFSALDMAYNALSKACENMKKDASPKISQKMGKYFSYITDDKYTSLFADSDMALSFMEKDGADAKDAMFLSKGTLEAAYISFRLSLCSFLYDEKPTLVFDDAFCNMDSHRLEKCLDLIYEISEDFQIIILSCHDREAQYFKDKGKIIDFAV